MSNKQPPKAAAARNFCSKKKDISESRKRFTSEPETTTNKPASNNNNANATTTIPMKAPFSKKRRWHDRFPSVVPPSHFLLGGNIHDPLNLKSIEASNDAKNHCDHQKHNSSGVDVVIPPNLNDPLNLNMSPMVPATTTITTVTAKRTNKRARTSSESEIGKYHASAVAVNCSNRIKDDSYVNHSRKLPRFNKRQQFNFSCSCDCDKKITASNLDCHQSCHPRHRHHCHDQPPPAPPSSSSSSCCDTKKPVFQYGNYNRYYGYRNHGETDLRIKLFRPEMFANKDVLDIGCNVGQLTITIAKDFKPRRMIGIDIDPTLITAARRNLRHQSTAWLVEKESFPISMPALYGFIEWAPGVDCHTFPNNVHFVPVNYVPESDRCLQSQKPEYDTILCLSLTKWIHLNWGDAGLKRLFRRIFLHLRPGGCLILEPQPWSTYNKRSKITPQTLENFRSIRFKPEHFHEFLLKEVGFKSCELLGTPTHNQKGFQRTIYMYTKK